MHTLSLKEHLSSQPRGYVSSFAERVGVSRVYLSQLAARQNGRQPSAALCVAIERETGERVRRWHLRPLDWHLIWPDLINAEGAPAVAADAPNGVPA